MTNTPNREWFDIVKFNFREMGAGNVGVHVWKSGYNCLLLVMPKTSLVDPAFWERLKDECVKEWRKENVPDEKMCPTCGGLLRLTARRYDGREFCAECGGPIVYAPDVALKVE